MVVKTGENIRLRRFVVVETADNLFSYVHTGDELGVLGEYQSAEDEEFVDSMHIVVNLNTSHSDIPSEVVSRRRNSIKRITGRPKIDGKPEKVLTGALKVVSKVEEMP